MTVKELMQKLSQMPPDAKVRIEDGFAGSWWWPKHVRADWGSRGEDIVVVE